jgi:hypothetical protein
VVPRDSHEFANLLIDTLIQETLFVGSAGIENSDATRGIKGRDGIQSERLAAFWSSFRDAGN